MSGVDRAEIERELADLVFRYCQRHIGLLMHQAEHWAENDAPLAVHHRVMSADAIYQVQVIFDPARLKNGWSLPFDQLRERLARPELNPPGLYPPSLKLVNISRAVIGRPPLPPRDRP